MAVKQAAMAPPREFVCVDCKSGVFTFMPLVPHVPPDVCAMCAFLRSVPDERRRAELRELLQGIREIGGKRDTR
jgi:hypothetical protein